MNKTKPNFTKLIKECTISADMKLRIQVVKIVDTFLK